MHGILELSLQLLNSFSPANLGAYASPPTRHLLALVLVHCGLN
jgi:hypothetical protein